MRCPCLAQPVGEKRHARLFANRTPVPDRPAANQVARHDAIGVTLAARYFVDANDLRAGCAYVGQFRTRELHLERLDRVPMKSQLLGNVLEGSLTIAPSDAVGKALGTKGIVGQEVELINGPVTSSGSPFA